MTKKTTASTQPKKELVTIAEFGRRKDVSRPQVYRMINEGNITCEEIGGRQLIDWGHYKDANVRVTKRRVASLTNELAKVEERAKELRKRIKEAEEYYS